jgi:hypothetical protein
MLGSFKVTKVINSNAYRLELPHSMKVRDVFHVSFPDRYVKPVPINIPNPSLVNNRAPKNRGITASHIAETHENPVDLGDEYHRENPPKQERLGGAAGHQRSRKAREIDDYVRRRQSRYTEASEQAFSHWASCALRAGQNSQIRERRHVGDRISLELQDYAGVCDR